MITQAPTLATRQRAIIGCFAGELLARCATIQARMACFPEKTTPHAKLGGSWRATHIAHGGLTTLLASLSESGDIVVAVARWAATLKQDAKDIADESDAAKQEGNTLDAEFFGRQAFIMRIYAQAAVNLLICLPGSPTDADHAAV